MTIEGNLRLLQLALPEAPQPLGDYVPALEVGNLLFVSGMLPIRNGAASFVGRVGQELTIESVARRLNSPLSTLWPWQGMRLA